MMRACGGTRLMAVCLCFVMCGCSRREQPAPPPSGELVFPDTFSQDGTSWTKQPELTADDARRLSEYFRRHPSVAENSLVSGTPVVYAAGRNSRRFYWSAAAIEGVEWLCIELGRGPARLLDGWGDPFGDVSRHEEK